MTSEDVPSALALVNKYSSQFEIRHVFTSEEEFSHHFLSSAVSNYVFTYVVENEMNKITDLLTYTLDNARRPVAFITTVVSTYIPIEQLIMDGMISARDNGAEFVAIGQQDNITKDVLLSLSFHPVVSVDFYFYNYKYHEIPESNFYIFLL